MPHVMKCHYEVLEAERNSDPDTLKKQYRKLALKVGYLIQTYIIHDTLYRLVPSGQEPG